MRSFSESYRAAGVDIEAGYKGVKLMQRHVARTVIPGVVSDLGGFAVWFAPNLSGMKEPVLVSVRTVSARSSASRSSWTAHDTVGIDCVACASMILSAAARGRCFSLIILPSEKTSRKRWHRWSPAWRRAASGQAAP